MTTDMKPLVFALADAIEVDLTMKGNYQFDGKRTAVLELFEGYSPTVVSSIESSMVDYQNSVVSAQMHVFGNLGVIVVVEGRLSHLSAFVYDRSVYDRSNVSYKQLNPLDTHWSRRDLYKWLEGCCKAIYQRSMFDTVWSQLPDPTKRLNAYNRGRRLGELSAKELYMTFWRLTNATESV